MKAQFATVVVVTAGFVLLSAANAAELKIEARALYEQSVTEHLRLRTDRPELQLDRGEVIEDDGPASGQSYQLPRNLETLSTNVWLKKDLIIPNPQARAAYLVVLSERPFQAIVNGTALKLGNNESGRMLHQAYAFDSQLLKLGHNEVILWGSGQVQIARDDEFALGSRTRTRHPNRSAKSTDGGKSWDYDHLGPDGKLDGEYGVRVFLDHYQPQGRLTTAVLDAGNLDGLPVGPAVRRIGPIRIAVDGEAGGSGRLVVHARTGTTYVPSKSTWSDWRELGVQGGKIPAPQGRFVQVAVEFSTRNALESPVLRSVTVAASPRGATDWLSHVAVRDGHNEQIIRTSIPFEYEPLAHPHLKQLRQQYKLDEVVAGAHTEMERMLRLAQWANNYWDWPNHIGDCYPAWDALEILKPYKDGKPVGGFCQQFNLVFLQACESFGIPGRAISISQGRFQKEHPGGGHEIVELWSSEFHKWVYVDGALAWYIVDAQTGIPLSMMELRDRQLQLLHGQSAPEVKVVDALRTRNKQFVWSGLGPPTPLNWYLELRMIPRSNFLQEKVPLPLNQGTAEWSWTGSYVWSDAEVPAGMLFNHRVTKRSNFQWTLEQAHYVLEAQRKPGVLRVHLDTETPSFKTFLAEIDGADKMPVGSGFTWTLHPGENRLRVRTQNVAGIEGAPSWVTLAYTP